MLQVTLFQGSSGFILNQSINPKFLIKTIPLFVFFALIAWTNLFFNLPHPFFNIVTTMYLLFCVGCTLFTLSARVGEYDKYFANQKFKIKEFSVVYLLFSVTNLVWYIPILIINQSNDKAQISSAELSKVLFFEPNLANTFIFAIAVIAVTALLFLFITTSSIVTANCYNLLDFFKFRYWKETLVERLGDVFLVFALSAAFVISSFVLYCIPFFITLLMFNALELISIPFTAYLVVFSFPFLSCSLVLGNLCGAYHHDNEYFALNRKNTVTTEPSYKSTTLEKTSRVEPSIKLADTGKINKKAPKSPDPVSPKNGNSQAANDLQMEIDETAKLHSENPEDLPILLKLILLYRSIGKVEEMVAHANSAISKALHSKEPDFASKIYLMCDQQKSKIRLEVSEYEDLAKILEGENRFVDAWRCYHRLMNLDGTKADTVQNKLLELAKKASANNKIKESQTLYQHFITKFPNSELRTYAENALEMLQLS